MSQTILRPSTTNKRRHLRAASTADLLLETLPSPDVTMTSCRSRPQRYRVPRRRIYRCTLGFSNKQRRLSCQGLISIYTVLPKCKSQIAKPEAGFCSSKQYSTRNLMASSCCRALMVFELLRVSEIPAGKSIETQLPFLCRESRHLDLPIWWSSWDNRRSATESGEALKQAP